MTTTTLPQMTTEEFQFLLQSAVENAVEKKLFEILGDPDEGLSVRQAISERLKRQRQSVQAGERGKTMSDIGAKFIGENR